MEKLYKGIHKFQKSFFKKEEDFFRRISERQTPEVLFITCADSRVDPNLITQSRPDELFILRNVGNIIPPYNAIKDKNSVAAALEFAVMELQVKDIIICGHSNCGAMKTLNKSDEELSHMPHLRDWLRIAGPVKNIVNTFYKDLSEESYQKLIEEENILMQLGNIQSYPFVEELLQKGVLYLHGWYYDIKTGEIYSYNPVANAFEKIVL